MAGHEVINSAGVMLCVLLVAVEGVLPSASCSYSMKANSVAHLLVSCVHGAIGLQGRSVFRVEGGIPVPPYNHGLSQGFVFGTP